jgi:hypothetical protein
MNAMRETEANGWVVHHSSNRPASNKPASKIWLSALRLAAVAVGIGLVMGAGAARAQEDDEDDTSFEQKIIKGIMTGIGGTNMDNRGIDYRERSPLVVPPKLDLPPPDSGTTAANAPNWPKDPDVAARKAAAEANKKRNWNVLEEGRSLTPAELATKRPRATNANVDSSTQPGGQNNPVLSPSQLGVDNGMLSKVFGGTGKVQTAPFKGEPTRDSLTQPPSGYQTPSPNYAYGTGPKEVMKSSSEVNPMTGKY